MKRKHTTGGRLVEGVKLRRRGNKPWGGGGGGGLPSSLNLQQRETRSGSRERPRRKKRRELQRGETQRVQGAKAQTSSPQYLRNAEVGEERRSPKRAKGGKRKRCGGSCTSRPGGTTIQRRKGKKRGVGNGQRESGGTDKNSSRKKKNKRPLEAPSLEIRKMIRKAGRKSCITDSQGSGKETRLVAYS